MKLSVGQIGPSTDGEDDGDSHCLLFLALVLIALGYAFTKRGQRKTLARQELLAWS